MNNTKDFNNQIESILQKRKYSKIFSVINQQLNRDRNVMIKTHITSLKKIIIDEFTPLINISSYEDMDFEKVKFSLQLFLREVKLLCNFMCTTTDKAVIDKKLKDINFKRDLKLTLTCAHDLISLLAIGSNFLSVKLLITTEDLASASTKKKSAKFYFCKNFKIVSYPSKTAIVVKEDNVQTKNFFSFELKVLMKKDYDLD